LLQPLRVAGDTTVLPHDVADVLDDRRDIGHRGSVPRAVVNEKLIASRAALALRATHALARRRWSRLLILSLIFACFQRASDGPIRLARMDRTMVS
jgi:hypothetical protein